MKMTDEDVLRLANEVDPGLKLEIGDTDFHVYRRFAALCAEQGALDMRERCAKACEDESERVLSKQSQPARGEFDESVNRNIRMVAVLLPDLAAKLRALTVGET